MKYKLIVLDLDGTLTNSKKVITPRNREILIRVQEQGVRLVLASGRPTYGIVPLANELRMNEFGGFILSYNGGEQQVWKGCKKQPVRQQAWHIPKIWSAAYRHTGRNLCNSF